MMIKLILAGLTFVLNSGGKAVVLKALSSTFVMIGAIASSTQRYRQDTVRRSEIRT